MQSGERLGSGEGERGHRENTTIILYFCSMEKRDPTLTG